MVKGKVALSYTVSLSDSLVEDTIPPGNVEMPVPGGIPVKKHIDSLRREKKKLF